MAANNQIIKNRYLAERSYLYYQYPQPAGKRSLEFYFPFLENIDISENQKPNLATYDLLGRNGNLFAYLGARSREFTIRFSITLPNVLDYITNVGLGSQFSLGPMKKRDYYQTAKNNLPLDDFTSNTINEKYKLSKLFNNIKNRVGETLQSGLSTINEDYRFNPLVYNYSISEGSVFGNNETDRRILNYLEKEATSLTTTNKSAKDAINYVVLLLNVIRTSTINNSKNTSLGPPAIYINHGTMYNNIPCICTGFSIDVKNNSGYDLVSLTPRQISISLNLSENRTGNFGDFKPFRLIESENLAGWEALVEEGTMDPYTLIT